MAEATNSLKVMVTGGDESAGLATVKALLQRGHTVVATAQDAAGALAIRQLGALPVYPDLNRASEVLSVLRMAKADALVHAAPQLLGGIPQSDVDYAGMAAQLVSSANAVASAAAQHGVKRLVSLSFAYLYEASHGSAVEGDGDVRDGDYLPMLSAEAALINSELSACVMRTGYIYGGNSCATTALADSIRRSQRLPGGMRPASWIHEDDLATAIVAFLEAEDAEAGVEIINVADDTPVTPNDFSAALSHALGLSEPAYATDGIFTMLRKKSMRDNLLDREIIIDSSGIRERFGWQPARSGIDGGMDATALVWRMQDAVVADDFYNVYDDQAAAAIEAMESGAALLASVAVEEAPTPQIAEAAPAPAPVKAAAPPPSDGPTPWNEDDAKREERRLKALERKAKRAAKGAGG